MSRTRTGIRDELLRAWSWREDRGLFRELGALRVFHGPGEGSGELRDLAVDLFGTHAWITQWGAVSAPAAQIAEFLRAKGVVSAVYLSRPEKGLSEEPKVVLGQPPAGRFAVAEGPARYLIQLTGARHPGLFLDHLPVRQWLNSRSSGWRLLNTFAYTGSLSVAAALGGAAHVTTLDLSTATIQWARENWMANGLASDAARWIAGDALEWLGRLRREGERFDCVILDPPSFSRGKKGSFSTSRDLPRLHEWALELVEDQGVLITSINSANVTWSRYEADVLAAARSRGLKLEVLRRIDQPETFPSPLGAERERYLKGWILRVTRG